MPFKNDKIRGDKTSRNSGEADVRLTGSGKYVRENMQTGNVEKQKPEDGTKIESFSRKTAQPQEQEKIKRFNLTWALIIISLGVIFQAAALSHDSIVKDIRLALAGPSGKNTQFWTVFLPIFILVAANAAFVVYILCKKNTFTRSLRSYDRVFLCEIAAGLLIFLLVCVACTVVDMVSAHSFLKKLIDLAALPLSRLLPFLIFHIPVSVILSVPVYLLSKNSRISES